MNEKESIGLNLIKLEKGETVNMSKALGSNKRIDILNHLSKEELNLSEIAEKIGSTPQAVYHHLQILEKSKLIYVAREKNIKNMEKTIKFYRANYYPDAINVLLWAPLEVVEHTELKARTPLPERPIHRIARKVANNIFKESNDYKIETLTSLMKNLTSLTHKSMNDLKNDYGLKLDEKLWTLLLFFSELSVMNAFKLIIEEEKYRESLDDLLSILLEEWQENQGNI